MKIIHWVFGALLLAIVWLCWNTLNLAIENDGLKQMTDSHRRSVEALLNYASVATRCSVTSEELAAVLKAQAQTSSERSGTAEVAHLAFKAQFAGGHLASVEIVDVGKVTVCQTR
jgi:4-amino-4-deoxy-L-arabinose transferase-like glycosyltransferase